MLFKKNLHATSPRLSWMLVQILDYKIEFHYQEANAKPIADFNVTIHDIEILPGFKFLSLELVKCETEANRDMQFLNNTS